MPETQYDIIVIGGGHAGAEAAWAAANRLRPTGGRVALITMRPDRIGAMSCNPAIGGLAKGQMVREIDALGGVMGLAIDATGIQFRILNASKGPAVRGPRAQADKYAYARQVRRLLGTRENLDLVAGAVREVLVDKGRCAGVTFDPEPGDRGPRTLAARAVVLTTGTFMRGLMHTGEWKEAGGRVGEGPAEGLSANLRSLGFELGRLKTGTCPRLAAETVNFDELPVQPGDDPPQPFSEMTGRGGADAAYAELADRFPVLEQRPCWMTRTNEAIHEKIRANLDRAPIFNGQIEADSGPRYCPSIEDKVVRFADKHAHHVFLEPESLETNEIYCNGIPTSLPADVQAFMVAHMPGCEEATILRPGYAVEYDMVWPHQIDATTMTKRVAGLFLAGQINGTSGYEEAGGQGLLAGLNAARYLDGDDLVRLGREQAYIGVLMDDLVTKTPREPYRMFTSRAEHRLMLRSDNAPERLTPLGREWGLVDDERWGVQEDRRAAMVALTGYLKSHHVEIDGKRQRLWDWIRRPNIDADDVLARFNGDPVPRDPVRIAALLSKVQYAGFIERHRKQWQRVAKQEHRRIPEDLDYHAVTGLRNECKHVLEKFQPSTLGQASRLAGITPADLTVLTLALQRE